MYVRVCVRGAYDTKSQGLTLRASVREERQKLTPTPILLSCSRSFAFDSFASSTIAGASGLRRKLSITPLSPHRATFNDPSTEGWVAIVAPLPHLKWKIVKVWIEAVYLPRSRSEVTGLPIWYPSCYHLFVNRLRSARLLKSSVSTSTRFDIPVWMF